MEREVDVQREGRGRATKRVRLIAVDLYGIQAIQAVEITAPQFFIGRSPCCQLQLGSPLVSRVHAMIERREGRLFVRDLETRNGTVHNGRTLHSKEMELVDGDRLMFGPCTFQVAIDPCREEDSSRFEAPADRRRLEHLEGSASPAPAPGPSDLPARPIVVKLFGVHSPESFPE